MDQNILDDDFRENGVNVDIPLRNKNNEGEKSSYGSALKAHLKIHKKKRKKSNICSQCDFTSSYGSALKAHLKIHRGEKSNKFSLSSSWSFGL